MDGSLKLAALTKKRRRMGLALANLAVNGLGGGYISFNPRLFKY